MQVNTMLLLCSITTVTDSVLINGFAAGYIHVVYNYITYVYAYIYKLITFMDHLDNYQCYSNYMDN